MKSHFLGNRLCWHARLLIVLLIALNGFLKAPAAISNGVAPDSLKWEFTYPKPTGENLTSVASGPPGFVAVGANAEILFSVDGLQWTNAEASEAAGIQFWAVCYAGDRYLATGDGGTVLWSFDGLHWTRSETGVTAQLRACTGKTGLYIVAGFNRSLLVSTDCITWEQRSVPDDIRGLALGNTNCVATSWGGIFTSTDLENWTPWQQADPGFGPIFDSVSYGDGRYIVAGAWRPDFDGVSSASVILSSADGETWELNGLDAFGERVATFAGGQFVAIQAGNALRSSDATIWEEIFNVPSHGRLSAICGSATGRFVAVGDSGEIVVSDDAQTWTEVTDHSREWLNAVAFGDGRFVAVGGSPSYIGGPSGSAAVYTSTNGYQWTVSLTNLLDQLSGVTHGRSKWVVAGDNGQIFVSRDAIHWTDRTIPNTSHDLQGATFGGGVFTAFTSFQNLVYRSRDGIHWHKAKAPGANAISKPRLLNHRLVAAGTNGMILFSADGLRWKARHTPVTQNLECVTYGNKRYVAGGDSVIVYSRDGKDWKAVNVSISVQQIEFMQGWFVAFGAAGEVFVSSDALAWHQLSGNGAGVGDIMACGNGVLIKGVGQSLYRGTLHWPNGP